MTTSDPYCPPTARPPIALADAKANAAALRGIPQTLENITDAQRAACLDFFKSLPLSDLRERQRINTLTQGQADRAVNKQLVLANCAVTEQLLADAIMAQQFPDADFTDE